MSSATPDNGESLARAAAPPRIRRSRMVLALAVLLVVVGALSFAYITVLVKDTVPVVVVAADVPRGEVITQAALGTAEITLDPGLDTVPAEESAQLVGKRAAVDLAAGGILTPGSVTDTSIPAEGESVVGVAVTPAQMPVEPLQAGALVRVVVTPRAQEDLPGSVPDTVAARVLQVGATTDSGQIVVDVLVKDTSAATLAALVATGRIAIVLDGE